MTKVTVFTQNNCQQCNATKRWMDKKNISYDAINMDDETNAGVRDRLIAQGHLQAPIVEIHDESGNLVESWGGFQPTKIGRYITE